MERFRGVGDMIGGLRKMALHDKIFILANDIKKVRKETKNKEYSILMFALKGIEADIWEIYEEFLEYDKKRKAYEEDKGDPAEREEEEREFVEIMVERDVWDYVKTIVFDDRNKKVGRMWKV